MKEYVHGLFTTSRKLHIKLYAAVFVESIRKHFVLTDETGRCCNRGLHSLFTSCSGLRSVFWIYHDQEMLR